MDFHKIGIVKWLEGNKVIVLVGVLLVLFLALASMSQPLVINEKQSAIDFVLKDVSGTYPNATIQVTNAEMVGNRWKVDVKISLDAHTACPTVFVRNYELLPIYFREQQRIKDCKVTGSIVFEEEAVAASAKSGAASAAAAQGALGYATYVSMASIEEFRNCTTCSPAFPDRFKDLLGSIAPQNAWVVEWKSPANPDVLIALDERGEILAQK